MDRAFMTSRREAMRIAAVFKMVSSFSVRIWQQTEGRFQRFGHGSGVSFAPPLLLYHISRPCAQKTRYSKRTTDGFTNRISYDNIKYYILDRGYDPRPGKRFTLHGRRRFSALVDYCSADPRG